MARLILLNGAPGVGKSTVARRLAADGDHPLLLVLDVDVVRSLLGATGDITISWLAARALALAMAEAHLRAGHDVIVPQYLGRPDFVEQLRSVARATDTAFLELALTTGPEAGRARFHARGHVPQLVGGTESWGEMYARLDALLAARAHVVRVDASGDVEQTHAALRAALAGATS